MEKNLRNAKVSEKKQQGQDTDGVGGVSFETRVQTLRNDAKNSKLKEASSTKLKTIRERGGHRPQTKERTRALRNGISLE